MIVTGFGHVELLLLVVLWVGIGGGVGALIGASRGRAGFGFVLGLFLGAIGWILVLLLTPAQNQGWHGGLGGSAPATLYRECPHCKEPMRRDAGLCPHCRSQSEPWVFHGAYWWVTRPSGSYYLDPVSQRWVLFEQPAAAQPPPVA